MLLKLEYLQREHFLTGSSFGIARERTRFDDGATSLIEGCSVHWWRDAFTSQSKQRKLFLLCLNLYAAQMHWQIQHDYSIFWKQNIFCFHFCFRIVLKKLTIDRVSSSSMSNVISLAVSAWLSSDYWSLFWLLYPFDNSVRIPFEFRLNSVQIDHTLEISRWKLGRLRKIIMDNDGMLEPVHSPKYHSARLFHTDFRFSFCWLPNSRPAVRSRHTAKQTLCIANT